MIKRINITIDDDLLNKIDFYSKKRYLTRSGLISYVLSAYLESSDVKGQYADRVAVGQPLTERKLTQR